MSHRLIPDTPYPGYQAYLAAQGSSAIERARALAPEAVIDEVARSGLRGRGGAGFPAGVKWASVRGQPCTTRFAVCNGAEGEPGTFKDRTLLRANPYAVIEGLAIAAHAVGARRAWVATKATYRVELERIYGALREMRDALGGLEVSVFEGPDEYLFGEEKALLSAIEGEGAFPRPAAVPPYEVGLFATPTSPNPACVSNVETLAHASTILRHGADSFRALGTADTPGTIIVSLSGDVRRAGVHEVEAGVPVGELIERLGGGPRAGRRVKAVLSGVSNGVLVAAKLDTPADFGSLARAGSGLGSAGFIVLDDSRSMAEVARTVARFLAAESCSQCGSCKTSLTASAEALGAGDFERAAIAARRAPQGNRCYLPVQGAILIPSLMETFADEMVVVAGGGLRG